MKDGPAPAPSFFAFLRPASIPAPSKSICNKSADRYRPGVSHDPLYPVRSVSAAPIRTKDPLYFAMKSFITVFLLAVLSIAAAGQAPAKVLDLSNYGVSIEPDKRLITVLASLEAAGVPTDLSEQGEEFRGTLEKDLAGVDRDLRLKLKVFVEQYAKRYARRYRERLAAGEPNENMRREKLAEFDAFFARYSQGLTAEEKELYGRKYESFFNQVRAPFISMAYTLSPVPGLDEPERSLDLPEDLLEVLDYSVLVREFYRSPGMARTIDAYHDRNRRLGDEMRPAAREMVRNVLDYLHTRPQLTYVERVKVESKRSNKKDLVTYETRERERSFRVVPDLLAARGTINFLNIKDNYYAIVPPGTDLSSSEVRRAYLQFVLDPLVLGTATEISVHQKEIRQLLDERANAGAAVSPDPYLAVTRSLVAAVDARERQFRKEEIATAQARRIIPLQEKEEDKRKVVAELEKVKQAFRDEALLQLAESYERGAVLAFYFAEKLRGLEESGFDIAGSLTDWIVSMKPAEESGRLALYGKEIERALAQREADRTRLVEVTTLVENPLTPKLLEVEKMTEAKRFGEAETRLKELLNENIENPLESARIYYALGRTASKSAEGLSDAEEVSKRLLKAKVYYENVLRIHTATPTNDAALISSTYFALGRIYEFAGQTDYAIRIYDAALRFGDVEGGAYKEAFEAKRQLVQKKDN